MAPVGNPERKFPGKVTNGAFELVSSTGEIHGCDSNNMGSGRCDGSGLKHPHSTSFARDSLGNPMRLIHSLRSSVVMLARYLQYSSLLRNFDILVGVTDFQPLQVVIDKEVIRFEIPVSNSFAVQVT